MQGAYVFATASTQNQGFEKEKRKKKRRKKEKKREMSPSDNICCETQTFPCRFEKGRKKKKEEERREGGGKKGGGGKKTVLQLAQIANIDLLPSFKLSPVGKEKKRKEKKGGKWVTSPGKICPSL